MIDLLNFGTTVSRQNHSASNDLTRQQNFSKRNHPKDLVMILGKDRDTRFLFKTAFEIWDYDVAEADDLYQAVSFSELKKPDLILMDAEIDLRESLLTIRKFRDYSLFDQCGIVLISGHAQENIRQKALLAGVHYFLVKPIDFEVLQQFVHKYFKGKKTV